MIQIPESVVKRNEERAERIERKKEEAGEQENLNEIFWETFKAKQAEIETLLDSAENIKDRQKLSEIFNNASKQIQALNKYVSTSALFLIAYDLRATKTILQELQEKASGSEKRLLPKKKFGFRKGVEEEVKVKRPEVEVKRPREEVDSGRGLEVVGGAGFSGRRGEVLTLGREELAGKDVLLSELEGCTVYLLGPCSTLHATHLSACRIFAGPVSTSVFVEDSQQSLFFLACQQLRVHHTSASDFYLHVTTKAIIEDSSRVRFAPYSFSYPGLPQDFQESGLDIHSNHWDEIDDFNWLVNNKQSPNWSIIDENERIELIK